MNSTTPPENAWIIETDDARFEHDVFEQSRERPVVVDFWAEWCQPCRMLTPLLEELARESGGEFVLVKANTEQCPAAAGQFQVQAIPTVVAVAGGELVDFFQGLLPREQLRSWLDRLLLQGRLQRAARIEQEEPEEAERIYRETLHDLPNESAAAIGLARVHWNQGRQDEARQMIEHLEKRGFLEPEAEKLKARMELQGMASDDLEGLLQAAQAEPDNLARQLELAEALGAAGRHEEALQRCLELVQKDKAGVGEDARRVMVDIFRVLPDDSPLVTDYRRKLTMALY